MISLCKITFHIKSTDKVLNRLCLYFIIKSFLKCNFLIALTSSYTLTYWAKILLLLYRGGESTISYVFSSNFASHGSIYPQYNWDIHKNKRNGFYRQKEGSDGYNTLIWSLFQLAPPARHEVPRLIVIQNLQQNI